MKLRHILKELVSPLPPAAQYSPGLKRDADFNPPEPTFLQTLLGIGSDNKIYSLPPEDAKRLRPVYLKSERTIRNEKIAAERARRRDTGTAPDIAHFVQEAPSPEPGMTPPSYTDLAAAFPDASPEARAIMVGGAPVKPEWGPRHQDGPKTV